MTLLLTPAPGGTWVLPGLSIKPVLELLFLKSDELNLPWFILFILLLSSALFLGYKYYRLRKSIIKNSNKAVIKNGKSLNFYSLIEINALLEKQQEEIRLQSEELKKNSEHLQKIIEELEMLSIVASKTDNVITIMDGEGNFEWVNDGFVKRYGMDLDQFIRNKGKNLIQSSSYPDIRNVIKKIQETGEAVHYNAKTIIDGNNFVWSNTTISPVRNEDGKITRLVAIDSDITKLKVAEEQIENQHEELIKLNSTKDKLFSIIAHDLKNPFHSIMGFTELLLRNIDSMEPAKTREFIRLIYESSSGAYSLLEKLLDWARTQTNRIYYEPRIIDVSQILRDVAKIMSLNAENKNIQLEIPEKIENPLVFADYNMIFTVLRNLISNALKYTPPGGSVFINATPGGDRLQISVSDTGIGIAEEDKEKLFKLDEFHTTAGTRGETGTGLGLIICREFLRKHGGDILVESKIGKGSTFSFSLPFTADIE